MSDIPVGSELAEWLALLLPPHSSGEIGVFTVSVDESGSHDRAPAIIVAGCVATVARWGTFTEAWMATRGMEAPPYHAKKASPSENLALAQFMQEYLTGGLVVTIRYDDFAAVVPHTIRSRFGAEYATAIRVMAVAMQEWCDHHGERWMPWLLEGGHAGMASVVKYLGVLAENPASHVWSHMWGSSKTNAMLHAPDLASHEVGSCYGRPPSSVLQTLLRCMESYQVSRDQLAHAVAVGEQAITEARRAKKAAQRHAKRKKGQRD